jgi:hypothetical protein
MAERSPVALDVVGRVVVEIGGELARVDALGDRIVVEVPSLRSGVSTIRLLTKGGGSDDPIRQVHDALTTAGLTLEVVAGGSKVGRLGIGARPGLASRLLRLGPLEVLLGGILGSFRKRADRPG